MQAEVQSSADIESGSAPPDELLLRALWPRSRELHYVAHYSEPLGVKVGDIGYISWQPPQFTSLDNVYGEISDGHFAGLHVSIQPLRKLPRDRWFTEEVQGIIRY
jgi:hypothetical protein